MDGAGRERNKRGEHPAPPLVHGREPDDYRRASIVHDIACNDSTVSRRDADKMFYYACLAGGSSKGQAKILYTGVRIGALAGELFPSAVFSRKKLLYRFNERPQIGERKVCLKFDEIVSQLQRLGDDAEFEEIEAAVDGVIIARKTSPTVTHE